MNNTIKVIAPMRRYGDTVINLNYVVEANVKEGKVWMVSAKDECECYTFPPEVVAAWFSDTMDYKKIEGRLTGGAK